MCVVFLFLLLLLSLLLVKTKRLGGAREGGDMWRRALSLSSPRLYILYIENINTVIITRYNLLSDLYGFASSRHETDGRVKIFKALLWHLHNVTCVRVCLACVLCVDGTEDDDGLGNYLS